MPAGGVLETLTFAIPIAVVYPIFFSKLVDVMYDSQAVRDMCKQYGDTDWGYFTLGSERERDDPQKAAREACRKQRGELEGTIEFKKFVALVVIGGLGIFGGLLLFRGGKTSGFSVAGKGIAFGGVLTILYNLGLNWHILGDMLRVFVAGLILIALIMGSFYMLR